MSVLIKGMEMPTSCARCPMLEGDRFDGMCHAASKWLDDDEFWEWFVYPEGDVDTSKPANCPLVPVPPHGRLIDADALIGELHTQFFYDGRDRTRVYAKIQDQPTVEPERKTGKWSVEFSPAYKGGAYCECSQCNYKFAMGAYFEPDEWKFCPNCGADMRGRKDG